MTTTLINSPITRKPNLDNIFSLLIDYACGLDKEAKKQSRKKIGTIPSRVRQVRLVKAKILAFMVLTAGI